MSARDDHVLTAATYYDEPDIARFYRQCWGGSDIHVGLYDTGTETIAEASAAMTRRLLERSGIGSGDRVLDIACGYGGTLRLLAKLGCHARGIDISRVCVEEARSANAAAGFGDAITVEIGDFHALEEDDATWDSVICQESLIHSNDRPKVFSEVHRVLGAGGVFAFSDILTAEGADISLVEAAFARLGAVAGATPHDYRDMAIDAGFKMVWIDERPRDIRRHYAKLAERLAEPVEGLEPDAAAAIARSIEHWQTALAGAHITWACFVAQKPG